MTKSRSYIATPPGATIKEQLDDRGMSQKEFASRMGMSEKHISNLINGNVQLTADVANRLESVLGVSARFWNNLESIYREKLAKACAENEMDDDIEIAKKLPYNEMFDNYWISAAKNNTEKVLNLRKYFEIAKLTLLNLSLFPGLACRRQAITEKADYALLAWAQQAKLRARNTTVSPINCARLWECLPEIRKMTLKSPDIFCSELSRLLSSCGIAIVFLPHIGGSFLHGATFYDKNKIVMGLTVRGKDSDKFWFSLFHEIGHIVYGHINNKNGVSDKDEYVADNFARNYLIPESVFNDFLKKRNFNKESILIFSRKIDIAPGIVVGRLQKEGYIDFRWHNDLKTKYIIT